MKINFLILSSLILSFGCASNSVHRAIANETDSCGYNGYQRNPDGTYVVGGAYNGYERNPDETYVVGGAYNGYQRNPDGAYVLGNCKKN